MSAITIRYDPMTLSREARLVFERLGAQPDDIARGALQVDERSPFVPLLKAAGAEFDRDESSFEIDDDAAAQVNALSSAVVGSDGEPGSLSRSDHILLDKLIRHDFRCMVYRWSNPVELRLSRQIVDALPEGGAQLAAGGMILFSDTLRASFAKTPYEGFPLARFLAEQTDPIYDEYFTGPGQKYVVELLSVLGQRFLVKDVDEWMTAERLRGYVSSRGYILTALSDDHPPRRLSEAADPRRREERETQRAAEPLGPPLPAPAHVQATARAALLTEIGSALRTLNIAWQPGAPLPPELGGNPWRPTGDESPAVLQGVRNRLQLLVSASYRSPDGQAHHSAAEVVRLCYEYGLSPREAATYVHDFVHPEAFPQIKHMAVPSGDDRQSSPYERFGRSLTADPSIVPDEVARAAGRSVLQITSGATTAGRGNAATLTCVGYESVGRQSYAIFATATHFFRQDGGTTYLRDLPVTAHYGVAEDVHLVAVPVHALRNAPHVIAIPPNKTSASSMVYTIGVDRRVGLGTELRYARTRAAAESGAGAAKRFGPYMTLRATSGPGDSGAPIVNKAGHLIGLVLGGDKRFTVVAFTDMPALATAVAEFRAQLSGRHEFTSIRE